MVRKDLNVEYFDWMYHLVCEDKYYKRLSYHKLLKFLHGVEFTYSIPLDENRARDGVDFRFRFGYEFGYPVDVIEEILNDRPCSVLEMMVALAFRVEEHIMDDSRFGDRTGQWFWDMIVSLGLGSMSDSNFNERYARQIIERFLNRDYEPNGRGGLFTIENPPFDMSQKEIWLQCMWHLNDVIDGY